MSNKLKEGDIVNYHRLIGGKVTSTGHEITDIELKPNNYGEDVAWITNKRGCVSMKALSKECNKPLEENWEDSDQQYERGCE